MVQLSIVTGLNAAMCAYHGIRQDRDENAVFSVTIADSLGPTMEGLLASLAQCFFLVRASQVSRGAGSGVRGQC